MLDPTVRPLREVARRSARRWDIELAVKTVKRHLGLHLRWSAKAVVIRQPVWAVLIISQMLQALQRDIAGRAGVDPVAVSLALLVEEAPRYAQAGRDPVAAFAAHGRAAGYLRPARRTQIRAPSIPRHQLSPCPPDLLLIRPARYAGRKAGDRSQAPTGVYPPDSLGRMTRRSAPTDGGAITQSWHKFDWTSMNRADVLSRGADQPTDGQRFPLRQSAGKAPTAGCGVDAATDLIPTPLDRAALVGVHGVRPWSAVVRASEGARRAPLRRMCDAITRDWY